MRLTKAQIKYIRSLALPKFRQEHGTFIAEGEKIVTEWIYSDAIIEYVVGTIPFIEKHEKRLKAINVPFFSTNIEDITLMSAMKSNSSAILTAPIPHNLPPKNVNDWVIVLDDISDPGNMGSIIRIADWFGIKNVVASQKSVDFYNPKVVQSAMGAHLRVHLSKTDLYTWLSNLAMPIYGTSLDGGNLYQQKITQPGAILIGSESHGLSDELKNLCQQLLLIPKIGGAESLNAAVSTGIIVSELLRQTQ